MPSVPVLRRLLAALDASLSLDVRWRAGALDRLLDEAHATVVGLVIEMLSTHGWAVQVEVSYSEYGERGSVDVLAYWPPLGILLVVEVKTDFVSVESVLRKLDEKVRLSPKVARDRFGWKVRHVAWLLVMPESSTLRRRIGRHDAVLRKTFPTRGGEARRWLRQPDGAVAGLMFVSPSHGTTGIQRRGGLERVRRARTAPPSQPTAA